jgi:hypothetical protein
MESLTENNISTTKPSFLNFVFNFDDENKNMLVNLFQFTFLAIPLTLLVLKLINHFTSPVDDERGSLELSLEITLTISALLLSIWFINKIVRYIPTFSGLEYSSLNESSFIVPFLIILFTMQTKFGDKINLLIERLIDLYDGKTTLRGENNEKNNNIKTRQPIVQEPPPRHMPSQSDMIGQQNPNIQVTPQVQQSNQVVNNNQNVNAQPRTDFNDMFAGPDINVPMAANEVLGGGFGTVF